MRASGCYGLVEEVLPCTFNNHCIPTDARLWMSIVASQLSATATLYNSARSQIFDRIVKNFVDVSTRAMRCTLCSDDVRALMSIRDYAAELAKVWASEDGVPVPVPVPIDAPTWFERLRPNTPVLPEMQHITWPDWAKALNQIPWGMIGLAISLLLMGSDRRRR